MSGFCIFICGALFGAGVAAFFAVLEFDKQDKLCKETIAQVRQDADTITAEAWKHTRESIAARRRLTIANAELRARLAKAQQILAGETEDE